MVKFKMKNLLNGNISDAVYKADEKWMISDLIKSKLFILTMMEVL